MVAPLTPICADLLDLAPFPVIPGRCESTEPGIQPVARLAEAAPWIPGSR
jgi:hypothetical protein